MGIISDPSFFMDMDLELASKGILAEAKQRMARRIPASPRLCALILRCLETPERRAVMGDLLKYFGMCGA